MYAFRFAKLHTSLGSAVLVGVVTSEEHVRLIGIDDTLIPSDRVGSRAITKVLLSKLRLGAPSEKVVPGMSSKLHSLVQTLSELTMKSGVARLVNGEGLLPSSSPVINIRVGRRSRLDGN